MSKKNSSQKNKNSDEKTIDLESSQKTKKSVTENSTDISTSKSRTSSKKKKDLKAPASSKKDSHQPYSADKYGIETLSQFLSLAQDLFAVLDNQLTFKTQSDSFSLVLGYDDDFWKEHDLLDIVHGEDARFVRDIFCSLTDKTQDDFDFECRLLKQDGTPIWMRFLIKRQDQDLYLTGRDITNRKKREKELVEKEKQLSQAQRIANMGYWHWDVGSKNVSWSEGVYTIFGVDQDHFKTSFSAMNACIHKRDLPRVLQGFERAVIDKRDYEIEFRITRKSDKETCYVLVEGRTTLNEQGEVVSLYGIIRDITERTNSERALRQAKEAAEQAYQSKSRFLANMSHELRTPLNAIIGFSEMIQRQLLGPIGNERYMDYIIGIRESGEHLLDLITDILDMSKIEAGKYELNIEEINIIKVMRLALHMMEGRAEENGVKLVLDVPEDLQPFKADRRAIMQILLNLLSNAVKFTPEEGQVTLYCKAEKDHLEVGVKDTGCGIPKRKLDRVLRPFEQVAGAHTRGHEGSGLGLSITKSLVELHGGELKLRSVFGKGTTAYIEIPYEIPSALLNKGENLNETYLDFDEGILEETQRDEIPNFRQFHNEN